MAQTATVPASYAASRVVHFNKCCFSSTARWFAAAYRPQDPMFDDQQPPRHHDERDGSDCPQRQPADAQFDQQRQQLLAAALRHVPQHGWAGGAAAAAAAAELGLSPAAAGILGSDAQLVQLFVADCNARLEQELADMQEQLGGMELRWVWTVAELGECGACDLGGMSPIRAACAHVF